MFRKVSTGLSLMLILACLAGCSDEKAVSKTESKTEADKVVEKALSADEYPETLRGFVGEEDTVGATSVNIFDVGEKYTIAATWFGLFVLNTESATVDSYVDLKKYDSNYFQGDIITKVRVDKKQENLYFYNTENEEVTGKVYHFDLQSKEIVEIPYREVPPDSELREQPVLLQDEEIEKLDSSLKDILKEYDWQNGNAVMQNGKLIFSTAEDWKLTKLKFVFVDVNSGEVKELSVLE